MPLGEFEKTRVYFKINSFPEEIVRQVDKMLSDKNNTYSDVKNFLEEKGFKISLGAIGRYALNRNKTLDKVLEAQEQAKALAEVIKETKDDDYTEAGIQIVIAELTKILAESKEDLSKMKLPEIIKLLGNLSRVKTQKTKTESELKSKRKLAFEQYEEEILNIIKEDDELLEESYSFLGKLRERFLNENN